MITKIGPNDPSVLGDFPERGTNADGDPSKKSSMALLEVFHPAGAIEVKQLHAPRLPDLNGKTICELSNSRWGTERTFPVIRQLLKEKFPDAKIIPYNEVISGKREIESAEQIGDMILAKGGQAVIAGNAA